MTSLQRDTNMQNFIFLNVICYFKFSYIPLTATMKWTWL